VAALRTCAFCETGYDPSARLCPKCGYPADGSFEAARAPVKPRKAKVRATETCPNCGDPFPAGRPACPHCGADAATGWKSADEIDEASVALPEFGDEDHRRVLHEADPGRVSLWSSRQFRLFVIGVILVAAMVVPLVLALRHL
jgi:ribosomal protein L32